MGSLGAAMAKPKDAPKKKKKNVAPVPAPKAAGEVNFDERGNPLCPGCNTNNSFELIDYGLSPERKKKYGSFMFTHLCKKCNIKIVYYKNITL